MYDFKGWERKTMLLKFHDSVISFTNSAFLINFEAKYNISLFLCKLANLL